MARVAAAILALFGVEILLILWVCDVPPRPSPPPPPTGFLRLAEPSILLTHPKGPWCVLLFIFTVAIATLCRDLAELTRECAEQPGRKRGDLEHALRHAFVLAGFTVVMALFMRWGG